MVDCLKNGTVNHDYLGITIVNAALNLPASTEMRQVMVAKFDSAQLWTSNLSSNSDNNAAYTTSAAAAKGVTFLSGITTTTAATAAAADAAVADMAATSFTGTPFSSLLLLTSLLELRRTISSSPSTKPMLQQVTPSRLLTPSTVVLELTLSKSLTPKRCNRWLTVTNVENVTLRGLDEDDTVETFNQQLCLVRLLHPQRFHRRYYCHEPDLGDTFALNSFAVTTPMM